MAGLLGLLDLGSGAITAQGAGVAVAGRNTANVNTDGYSRETLDLSALPGVPLVGGVLAGSVSRAADNLLSNRERQAQGDLGRSTALATSGGQLVQQATPQGQDLVQSLASLFGSIGALAASPTDIALRQQVLSSAQSLADSYRAIAASIAQAQAEADASIKAIADKASQLALQLANLNAAVATSSDPVLQDRRDATAKQLSNLTGGQARIDPDGMMRFVVAGGQVLVDGTHASSLRATLDGSTSYGNHARIDIVDGVHVTDVTRGLTGGQLAGLVAFRDGPAAQAASSLDQLAWDTASRVNAIHAGGAGLDGNSGRNLFAAPAQVEGAAAAFAVDPAVAEQPALVAAAQAGGATGDGRNALALAALADQLLAGGGTATFSDQAIGLFSQLGTAARTAADTQSLDDTRVDVLKSARDSLSGVSTQEELARLAQFQHASEAATKFVSVVNDLLGEIIHNL